MVLQRQPSGGSGSRGASYFSEASGRRATELYSNVQTMLSLAASAGLHANLQPDYGRQLTMWKASYSVRNVSFRLRWAALLGYLWNIVGKPIKQLFTIHCSVRKFKQSFMLPVMYVIMPSKEASSYSQECQFLLVPTYCNKNKHYNM